MKSAYSSGLCAALVLTLTACAPQQAKVDMAKVELIPRDAALRFLQANFRPYAPDQIEPCILRPNEAVVDGEVFAYTDLRTRIETYAFTHVTNIDLMQKGLFPKVCAYYQTPKDQRGRDAETVDKIGTALLSLGIEVDTK